MNRKITTAIIIIAILALIVSLPFAEQIIPKELYAEYGVLIMIVPVIVLIVLLIIIGSVIEKIANKKPKLEDQRNELVQELKIAEKQFLKHKIDKKTYDGISKKKNSKLIEVESNIDSQKKGSLSEKEVKKLDGISKNKQKVLKGLLEQKHKKVHELKITEKSYLKRKIDEKTFKQIRSKISEELISIDSKIKIIQTTEQIKSLEMELKTGAKEIAKQKKSSDKRKKQLTELEMLEEDLLSQMR
ncbi:MAG: hypothetical protein HN878_01935 [Candidatus Diapherotrites archaeon]|nr:hypothetical protein [Candidatus Diapherotrites archaeon]